MNADFRNAPHHAWHRRLLRRYGFGFRFVNGRGSGVTYLTLGIFFLITIPLYVAPFVFLALMPVRDDWSAAFEATRWIWFLQSLFFCASMFFGSKEMSDAFSRRTLINCPIWIWLLHLALIAIALANEQFDLTIALFWGLNFALHVWRFARRREFFCFAEALAIATVLWMFVRGEALELWAALAFMLMWRSARWIFPAGTIRQYLRWKPSPQEFVQHARERFEAMPSTDENKNSQATADLLRALRASAQWDEAHQFLEHCQWPKELQKNKSLNQLWRASLLYNEKRYAESLGALSAEAALKGDKEVLRAQIHARLQQFSKAQEWITRAKRKKYLDVSCALGAIEEEKGNPEKALRYFEDASLRETFPFLRDMARVLMSMNDWQEAAPLWERAFRFTEFVNADDLLQAATCWRKAGNARRADYLERELARWEYSQSEASNAKGALD